MADKINIPVELLKVGRFDKDSLELLALSVCIKMSHVDSQLRNVSPTRIMEIAHCGHAKAKKLMNQAKANTELFTYNERKNILFAKNFKEPYIRTITDKHGNSHKSCYFFKLERKEYQLRQLVRIMHDALFKNCINAQERSDEFQGKNKNVMFKTKMPLTQKNIAKVAGLNNTKAVYRMRVRLEKQGDISYSKPQFLYRTNCISDDALSHQRLADTFMIIDQKNGTGYVLSRAQYSIKKREVTNQFKHVILDHSKRCVKHERKCEVVAEDLYYKHVAAYYERMEH